MRGSGRRIKWFCSVRFLFERVNEKFKTLVHLWGCCVKVMKWPSFLSKRWSSHAQSLRKKKEEDRSKLLVKEWKRNWIVPSHGNGEGSAVEGDKRN